MQCLPVWLASPFRGCGDYSQVWCLNQGPCGSQAFAEACLYKNTHSPVDQATMSCSSSLWLENRMLWGLQPLFQTVAVKSPYNCRGQNILPSLSSCSFFFPLSNNLPWFYLGERRGTKAKRHVALLIIMARWWQHQIKGLNKWLNLCCLCYFNIENQAIKYLSNHVLLDSTYYNKLLFPE